MTPSTTARSPLALGSNYPMEIRQQKTPDGRGLGGQLRQQANAQQLLQATLPPFLQSHGCVESHHSITGLGKLSKHALRHLRGE